MGIGKGEVGSAFFQESKIKLSNLHCIFMDIVL